MPHRLRALAGVLLAASLLIAGPVPTSRAATTEHVAASVVQDFNAVLLDIMKNGQKLGIRGRFERIKPAFARSFDVDAMLSVATGDGWAKATPQQRDKLADAFERFSAATYAAQFDSYDGQSFQTLGVTPGPRGTMVVATRLNQPNDTPVKLSYVTHKADGQWGIVDVLVGNGISQLAVSRSEYRCIIASKGIAGLIAQLNSKADKLLNQG